MTLSLDQWSRGNQSGVAYDMTVEGAWEQLALDYASTGGNLPLSRVFEIAKSHGTKAIVKESRYIDGGWRSQLARFYNGTFRRYPSVCHRLHFFTCQVPSDLADLSDLQDAYKGYAVLRPLPLSPVGRTMIAPPPEMDGAVRNECTEQIDLFGWRFEITAMPFMSQDTQFLRCAHAALWMVLQHGHLRHGMPHRLPSEIHDAATGGVMVGRQLPSDGLSAFQLFSAMTALGLSPTRKPLRATAAEDAQEVSLRLFGMICRYINSSLPPIVISTTHAWVMVGYKRSDNIGDPTIQLWRHDDARGPYMPVGDPWNEPEEAHKPWLSVYLPLLPKAFLDAERAELVGRTWVDFFARTPSVYDKTTLRAANDRPAPHDQATYRTYLIRSNEFKENLVDRGVPSELAAAYRLMPMSKYIWVVEIVDRKLRQSGHADVLGEVILDATLTQFEPLQDPASVMALHVDNFAFITGVDQAPSIRPSLPVGITYETGCPVLN
jgi:hypothetical protein